LRDSRQSGKRERVTSENNASLVRGHKRRTNNMPGKLAPPWSPRNRKIGARNARLRRIMAKGLTPKSKAELRALAAELEPRKP
jgi:hypothetical protein